MLMILSYMLLEKPQLTSMASLMINDTTREKKYKKVAGRLSLFSKMRQYLNVEAALKIYEIIIYSSLIMQHTATKLYQLRSLDSRV